MAVEDSRPARPRCFPGPFVSLWHWRSGPPGPRDRNEKPDESAARLQRWYIRHRQKDHRRLPVRSLKHSGTIAKPVGFGAPVVARLQEVRTRRRPTAPHRGVLPNLESTLGYTQSRTQVGRRKEKSQEAWMAGSPIDSDAGREKRASIVCIGGRRYLAQVARRHRGRTDYELFRRGQGA
jgi:hypothetical protein